MKCPHCAVEIHVDIKSYSLGGFPSFRDGDKIRPIGIVGIPAKPNAKSGMNPNGIPG
jgi:hypothetical protein